MRSVHWAWVKGSLYINDVQALGLSNAVEAYKSVLIYRLPST